MAQTYIAKDLGVATGTINANGDYSYGNTVGTTSGSHVTLNADVFSVRTRLPLNSLIRQVAL